MCKVNPGFFPQSLVAEKTRSPSARTSKAVEKCRVTFEYNATTGDELTLVVGDIVTILNKNCEDDGWWEGEIIGKDGK